MLSQLIDQIYSRHLYWHQYLQSFASQWNIVVPVPEASYDPRWHKWAGIYYPRSHRIRYVLPYVITETLAGYDETIAHEMCHAFQDRIIPMPELASGSVIKCMCTEKHGEFFHFLLKNVCGFARGKHHRYDIRKAKKVEEVVITMFKMEALSNTFNTTDERKAADEV